MTWEYAQGKMMWGLFYLFAGGTALGRVVTETGKQARLLRHCCLTLVKVAFLLFSFLLR